jgi:hypothetical protein
MNRTASEVEISVRNSNRTVNCLQALFQESLRQKVPHGAATAPMRIAPPWSLEPCGTTMMLPS